MMKDAGYKEKYRREVLKHAMRVYDKKCEGHRNGSRPIFRPKTWKREEGKMAKEEKDRIGLKEMDT